MLRFMLPWPWTIVVSGVAVFLVAIQVTLAKETRRGEQVWAGQCEVVGVSTGVGPGLSISCPHGDYNLRDDSDVRAYIKAAISGAPPVKLDCTRRRIPTFAEFETYCEVPEGDDG